jgi:hypothetical protein
MKPSKTGVLLIAFLLCPTSALLWVGKRRWSLFYLAFHIVCVMFFVALAYAGLEPLHLWGQQKPQIVLYLANAVVALPAFLHASQFIDEKRDDQWFSKWYAVVAAYAVIGIAIYHYAKPFLVE